MASKVDQFLNESGGNNFTETAPRPPVPGEENEKESNGGMSTRSSGSHKSQLSHCSGRSVGSNNPATPRKSNIEKNTTAYTNQAYNDEMDAPLGFEPEGSANNSPPFTENSTPPYIKWAENIHMLLDDRDGVQLFRTFLEQEGIGTGSVDFWFACQGVKKMADGEVNTKIFNIIKVINKKYIKSDKLPCLDAETKKSIADLINRSEIQVSIFNAAQEIVERYMEKDTYPLFINSDLYVQYVSRGGESPKSSNSSSGSNSARPMSSGPLPTLKEDQELQADDFVVPFAVPEPPKARTQSSEYSKRQEVFSTSYPFTPKQIPYHISYAPVSAQDSELQSLSSQDCLTDDTRSLTDSSIDGHSYRESRKTKKYLKAMQRKAGANRESGPFIPRTDRAPKDRNIAETDPEKFAELLISKLERVKLEIEKQERVQQSMSKVMNSSDISETLDKSTASSRNHTTTSIMPLLTSSLIEEENADSILEEHCSRIWESSAQQTPSRSPGRHSPRSKSPDRSRRSLSQPGSSSMPGTLQTKHLHKKRTEFYSLSSIDSGVEGDVNKHSVETHKHIHHHHHHHHDRRRSKHKLEIQAQQHSMVCWADTPRPHGSVTRQKPVGGRNHSDVCSNLDSGISTIESIGQPPDVIVQDPTTSKVMQWILDNENMKRGQSSTYPDSDKTSSTKRSHKSTALAPVPPQPYNKQSTSKKGSSSHGNRSASADSSYRVPWIPQPGMMGPMPSQPISQDPSMPLMPQPNTMVQLHEVHRRLEADQALKTAPVKSKSFAGVQSKDKRMPMTSSQSSNQVRNPVLASARTAPELDASWEGPRSEKRTSKRSSGSGDTSTSSKAEETVIGYYLCGEPIPYRITVPQPYVTLGQLKQLISKRGLFRFFVKTHNKDFDSEVVYEEIKEDGKILPVFEGKVVVKIDRIDEDKANLSISKK